MGPGVLPRMALLCVCRPRFAPGTRGQGGNAASGAPGRGAGTVEEGASASVSGEGDCVWPGLAPPLPLSPPQTHLMKSSWTEGAREGGREGGGGEGGGGRGGRPAAQSRGHRHRHGLRLSLLHLAGHPECRGTGESWGPLLSQGAPGCLGVQGAGASALGGFSKYV